MKPATSVPVVSVRYFPTVPLEFASPFGKSEDLELSRSRAVSSLLYGVPPNDPTTFAAVVAALGGATLLASYLPARRAMRVAPSEALRAE